MTLKPEERALLSEHRMNRADETLSEAKLLLDNKKFAAAINRTYYSIFYALTAMAITENFKTGKHAQLIGWFNRSYVKTGRVDSRFSKIISRAFDKRMLGDYADMPLFSENEVSLLISDARDFIEMIKALPGD